MLYFLRLVFVPWDIKYNIIQKCFIIISILVKIILFAFFFFLLYIFTFILKVSFFLLEFAYDSNIAILFIYFYLTCFITIFLNSSPSTFVFIDFALYCNIFYWLYICLNHLLLICNIHFLNIYFQHFRRYIIFLHDFQELNICSNQNRWYA